ncbi:hypothetical protein B9M40_001198 [Salmonella enterica subsp. enterica serovar Praha]|nr:hypothetical protein [Salmonella enterica subsp. enterica serovar Praha]EGF0806021.1 hypothetical protein [Salmonella enterica]EGF6457474.1 hypothetical protein [Salmonella enterica]EGH3349337.1 hypothetical protein [Salmonella enterica]EJA6454812.1 hypothetical protein [Salmonella enterica subsp. enterica serovar Praha]
MFETFIMVVIAKHVLIITSLILCIFALGAAMGYQLKEASYHSPITCIEGKIDLQAPF